MNRPVKHVLLVAASAPESEVICSTLARLGFIVHPRGTSAEAEARINECKHIDLAILKSTSDAASEACGRLLRARFPRLPIICMAAEPDRQRIRHAVPDAQIVTLPLSIAELLRAFIY